MLFGHILPFFGPMPANLVPGTMYDQYIKKRKSEIHSKAATSGGVRAINLELLCLSAMSKWACLAEVKLMAEPLKVPQLQYRRPVPMVWTRDELSALWKAFEPNYRARYVCLYNAGMRSDEMMRLAWPQIDWDGKSIYVIGKGNKQRIVPMNTTLFSPFGLMPKVMRHHTLVFPSRRGGQLYHHTRAASHRIETLRREEAYLSASLATLFRSHTLAAGGDLQTIQDTLGHEDITTTQIYTQTVMDMRRKLVEGIE